MTLSTDLACSFKWLSASLRLDRLSSVRHQGQWKMLEVEASVVHRRCDLSWVRNIERTLKICWKKVWEGMRLRSCLMYTGIKIEGKRSRLFARDVWREQQLENKKSFHSPSTRPTWRGAWLKLRSPERRWCELTRRHSKQGSLSSTIGGIDVKCEQVFMWSRNEPWS